MESETKLYHSFKMNKNLNLDTSHEALKAAILTTTHNTHKLKGTVSILKTILFLLGRGVIQVKKQLIPLGTQTYSV